MKPLKFEVESNAPLSDVWHAWTDTEAITRWFSPEANIEPELGGAYELFFDPADHDHMSTKGCVITDFQPIRCLSFNWKGPDQFTGLMNDPNPLTHVSVVFLDEKGRTRVFVEHGGWGEGGEWAEAWKWHKGAWADVLNQLRSYLSTGKGSMELE